MTRDSDSVRRAVCLNILAGLSTACDVFAITGLSIWATLTGEPLLLMHILRADVIPGIFLGYVGGKILDSLKTPLWWIAGLVLQAGLYCFLAVNFSAHNAIVVTLASSALSALYGSVAFVHRQRLAGSRSREIAKKFTVFANTGTFIGMAAAGISATLLGAATCMLVNAGTFVAMACAVPALVGF